MTLFLIQPGTPDAVKKSIFRRINTGGLVLNDQEIRNAMANPLIRTYLEELATDAYLKKTIGDQSRRMVDQEMVLRFKCGNQTSRYSVPKTFWKVQISLKSVLKNLVKGFELGAADYVKKPFESAELLVRIKTHDDQYKIDTLFFNYFPISPDNCELYNPKKFRRYT